MDLQSFVKESLVQISKGIEQARDTLLKDQVIVNPRNVKLDGHTTELEYAPSVQDVHFDLAVTAGEAVGGSGGLGIIIAPLTLGFLSKFRESSTTSSRIQFKVPIVFPYSEFKFELPKKE